MSAEPLPEPAVRLLDAAALVLPGWLERSILDRLTLDRLTLEHRVTDAVRQRVEDLSRATANAIMTSLTELLTADVDRQSTSPLALIRGQMTKPNELLAELGAPRPLIDDFERRNFPHDEYRLGPTSWTDIDESLQEPGLVWGAWKAFTSMRRHGATDD